MVSTWTYIFPYRTTIGYDGVGRSYGIDRTIWDDGMQTFCWYSEYDGGTGNCMGKGCSFPALPTICNYYTTPQEITAAIDARIDTLSVITINGCTSSINYNTTCQLTAIGGNIGNQFPLPTQPVFTWTSSNDSIATVNQTGIVTGVSGGTVDITASSGSISNSITLDIVGPVVQDNNWIYYLGVGLLFFGIYIISNEEEEKKKKKKK